MKVLAARVLATWASIAGCAGGGARPEAVEVSPIATVTRAPEASAPGGVAGAFAASDAGADGSAVAQAAPVDLAQALERAPRVALESAPLRASSPRPIGKKPAGARTLKEVGRVKDGTAVDRQTKVHAYDPSLPYELIPKGSPRVLPTGVRRDLPLRFGGGELDVIADSGGRLLLIYAARFVAVVKGDVVEQVVDMDPPSLPLTADERFFSDVHQALLADGVLYVCRGYNAGVRSRKGYVTAVDVATGQLRWRSPEKTCGGVIALMGDHVVTGYGAIDTPYALKLLSRHDGSIVQSIQLFGAAIELPVAGVDDVIAATFKHRVTYRLQP